MLAAELTVHSIVTAHHYRPHQLTSSTLFFIVVYSPALASGPGATQFLVVDGFAPTPAFYFLMSGSLLLAPRAFLGNVGSRAPKESVFSIIFRVSAVSACPILRYIYL